MDCVICKNTLEGDSVVVHLKGLQTLIKFSKLRCDGLENVFSELKEIRLHTSCRKKYIKEPKSINKPGQFLFVSTATDTASDLLDFPFHEQCFFCCDYLDDDKEKKKAISKRRGICGISQEKTKQTILNTLRNQPSTANEMIIQRIENVNLVDARARYHKDCYTAALKPKKNLNRGRPVSEDISCSMQIIFDFIENSEDSQFSLNELKLLLKEYEPSNRTIIKKLHDHFKDRILVTNTTRGGPIITLRDSVDNILRDSWNSKKFDSKEGERIQIVKKAAEIIREEICLKTENDKCSYPSPDIFLQNAMKDVPESLHHFLNTLAGPRSENETVKRKLVSIAHEMKNVFNY